MAISSVGSYTNSYENLYTYNQTKKSETSEISEVKTETTKKSNNEEYLKSLQKQVPYMKLQIGYGLNTSNDGKVNVVDVNPKLVEKMQNDPKAAKEYTQRLKDVESALKWLDNYKKSVGSTVIVSHDYIDENGNLSHFSVSIRKDEMNERPVKKRRKMPKSRLKKPVKMHVRKQNRLRKSWKKKLKKLKKMVKK